jgi:outer membrane lipoprotein-sorting protein
VNTRHCKWKRNAFWGITFALVISLILVAVGCSGPPWPSAAADGHHVLQRLRARKAEIHSATYHVRWRAKGTEPHAEFILDIAYKAPERFRISATGPFGVPAFTAVVIEEDFWFVDHHNGGFIADELSNLDAYEMPLSSFFSGLWRDLFAGGWGGSEALTSLAPSAKRDRYTAGTSEGEWMVDWNQGKDAPKRITVSEKTPTGTTVAEMRFGHMDDALPYWEMEGLELSGFPGGGRHIWKILRQQYNIEIPDRFFAPLREPQSALNE